MEAGHLRRQRDLFAAIAACLLVATGLALPRKIAIHRELKALNGRLVELQAAIVDIQQQIRAAEGQLVEVQQEIGKREAQ